MSELRVIAERIKRAVGVRTIAARFGFDYSDHGDRARYPCPVCRETSSSKKTVSVYDGEDDFERWKCFSCDAGGDCIDWLGARLDCKPYEAINRLATIYGISSDGDAILAFITDELRPTADLERAGDTASSVRAVRAEWWRWRSANPDASVPMVASRVRVVDLAEQKARAGVDGVAPRLRAVLDAEGCPAMADDRMARYARNLFNLYRDRASADDSVEFLAHEVVDAKWYVEDRRWMNLDPFEVGYCPMGFGPRASSAEELAAWEEMGFVSRRGSTLRHRMGGRVVFPIRAASGRVVALAGRTIVGDAAKYLNTREWGGFSKGSVLFGLSENLDHIARARTAVLVEGYADVLAMRRLGSRLAVAAMGTAVTPDHAEMLSRVAEEVVVMMDGDEAGRRAAERAVGVLASTRYRVSVASLPRGLDPDDATPGQLRAALARREGLRPRRGPSGAWIESILRGMGG